MIFFIFFYLCTGANEKPKNLTFKSFPKSVTVQEKESVEIECEILGKPSSGKYVYNYCAQRSEILFGRGCETLR